MDRKDKNQCLDKQENQGDIKGNKRGKDIFFKTVLVLGIILAVLTTGIYVYLQSFSNNSVALKEESSIGEKHNSGDVSKKSKEDEINKSTNFLVVGVDNGDGDENNKKDPRRTDTMMVVHYNHKEKKYDVISIPRDTKVKINGNTKKINDAHFLGKVPLAVETVEDLLNIKIDHYVKVDTIAFRKFIDALGGIEVVVDRDMFYDDKVQNLHINLSKSDKPQLLDGKQAEDFIRWRKNNDDTGYLNGDLDRIKHMQDFFNTVLGKVQSPSIIPKIPGILAMLPKYIETDLNAADIMKYSMSLAKMEKEKIGYHTIPGEAGYEGIKSYFFYDDKESSKLKEIFTDGELAGKDK